MQALPFVNTTGCIRPRRLRQKACMRDLVQENWIQITDLVQPLFVIDGHNRTEPIEGMPGICRLSQDLLLKECEELSKLGIRSIALFPYIEASLKDPLGQEALNPNNIIAQSITEIKKRFPELLIIADVALDPYTSHGHDGVLDEHQASIDNDKTVGYLAQQACLMAQVGADVVAPSDMMDGRIGVIRKALDVQGFEYTAILAYTAKFSSSYYGPFRHAVGSPLVAGHSLSKKTYQINPANGREALRQAQLDIEQGADMIMVKPAGVYLDIIRQFKESVSVPVVGYQVSGEYAQIHAAAQKGWLHLEQCRDESLLAIKRAGADCIYTYFAKNVAQSLC